MQENLFFGSALVFRVFASEQGIAEEIAASMEQLRREGLFFTRRESHHLEHQRR